MPHGMILEIITGSFGIAAAILLVGGWMILRLQRDRQHFRLMQIALEKGITSMPGMVPGWVISLRQGFLTLVLGVGVSISGTALIAAASSIDQLPSAALIQDDQTQPEPPPPPPGYSPRGNPMRGDQGGDHPFPPPDDHSGQHPPFNPAMERWHRIETQKIIGEIAACAGAILAFLGIVRILFSRIERKYSSEITGISPAHTQP